MAPTSTSGLLSGSPGAGGSSRQEGIGSGCKDKKSVVTDE